MVRHGQLETELLFLRSMGSTSLNYASVCPHNYSKTNVCTKVCEKTLSLSLILKKSYGRSCPELISGLWTSVYFLLSPHLHSLGPLLKFKAFLLAINLNHRADSYTHLWWLASTNGSLVPTKYSHNSWKDFVTLHLQAAWVSWIKQKSENELFCLDC